MRPVIVYFGSRDAALLREIVGNPSQVIVVDYNRVNSNIGDLEREVGKASSKSCKYLML